MRRDDLRRPQPGEIYSWTSDYDSRIPEQSYMCLVVSMTGPWKRARPGLRYRYVVLLLHYENPRMVAWNIEDFVVRPITRIA